MAQFLVHYWADLEVHYPPVHVEQRELCALDVDDETWSPYPTASPLKTIRLDGEAGSSKGYMDGYIYGFPSTLGVQLIQENRDDGNNDSPLVVNSHRSFIEKGKIQINGDIRIDGSMIDTRRR